MASTKRSPAAVAARGARKHDLPGKLIASDIHQSHIDLQVRRVLARAWISEPTARLIAEMAFQTWRAA